MMKIAIAGATGRMGKMLIEAALNCTDAELVGALEHESCPLLGEDAEEISHFFIVILVFHKGLGESKNKAMLGLALPTGRTENRFRNLLSPKTIVRLTFPFLVCIICKNVFQSNRSSLEGE